MTRSTNFEENEEVVCDILDHFSVELDFVLPQFANEQCEEDEFSKFLIVFIHLSTIRSS